ncbi:Lon protease family protein [Dethiosulfovibrio salsuginis]|uniref:endopeptidase La n=1 Tax=Dethiosulfovibrio salsuginis TaxID=561720 RepID=A0A1X7I8G5_9BACT|nr:ATP-binding protein [Dethiosulfovibrio salsuginis]SMG10660.1 lon-related putative ATP-dependent protease [Dethiosulfovibrio salsuginis]
MSLKDVLELNADSVRRMTDPSSLDCSSTEEVECLTGFIGQERAVKAMDFGLSVNSKGYNIFVVGNSGSGRTTYALDSLKKKAQEMDVPDDLVYVYNFDNPGEPIALLLPAGKGKEMESTFSSLIDDLKLVISKAFEKGHYEDTKAQEVKVFQEEVNARMEEIKAWAWEKGFSVKRTPQGFVNIPLQEEVDEEGNVTRREIQPEEFEELGEDRQRSLQEESEEISQRTLVVLREIRDMEKELKKRISELESEICKGAIQGTIDDIREKFGLNDRINSWIDSFTKSVIDNFGMFVAAARDDNAEVDFSIYRVNPVVCNDPENGAPVIWETNPTYYNLMGKVEYESRQGYLYTDFRKIVAGAILKANGGFLVLDMDLLLRNFMSYEGLKRVLRTGKLSIENLGEQFGAVPMSSLRPEAVDINVKMVLVGTYYLYYLLQHYDPEFRKMFKLRAEFQSDMERTSSSEHQMAQFITTIVKREKGPHFNAEAVAEIIDWSSRLAGDRDRLSIQFNKIIEVIVESIAWARMDRADMVSRDYVYKAIQESRHRASLVEERIKRAFVDGVIRIDTEGDAIGQINGLAVIDLGDYAFGHPSRITANTYMGKEGVVNIERETSMAGPIHNKGHLTLSSYLGRKYAQDMPLTLSASISFEQNYGGIEGDSASSTELYCLLSSLSEVAINQSIAVTGSVDQFGNIQPIGGVNEKIEGFFSYCKERGLTGEQGVMIPHQNEKHLMLNREVVEAIKDGKFHVWKVHSVDEGIEILTGIPAGKPNSKGDFPKKSIHGKVKAKLQKWMKDAARIHKEMTGQDKDQGKKGKKSKKTQTSEEGEAR